MCGIVGIINLSNFEEFEQIFLENMTNTMFHRGPDEWSTFKDSNIAFGHRRLKIIDLSVLGKQPMFDITNNVCITFNGEIYNYAEIKEELLKKGYQFRSNSDTEVILNSYIEYGIDCINKFIGMFAFAIYDKRNSKVFIARDRLGIKPLYYSNFDGRLIFASEIKAILKYPNFKYSPDMNGISSYLSYRYPISDFTLFDTVKSLLPGHYIEISDGKTKIRQYWELPINEKNEDLGERHYIENIRKLFESSVKYRMISDVPIGAYLSGGLDSSAVVAIMSKFSNEPVKTFTIGFDEEGFNEFDYAKQVANYYKTKHYEIVLSSDDYIDNMVKLIGYKDAPLGVPNEPALHVMSKELKKYITVVLSGEGSDEIFGGYGRIFRSPYDYIRLKELEKDNNLNDNSIIKLLRENLSKKYGNKQLNSELAHFLHNYGYLSWADKEAFMSQDMTDSLKKDEVLDSIFAGHFSKIEKSDIINSI